MLELSEVPFGVLASVKDELDMVSDIRNKRQKVLDVKKRLKEMFKKNEENKIKKKRSNKHAPLEISSKKPVSRFRKVVPVKVIERRDPRFDFQENHVTLTNLNSKYSFIKKYQEDEVKLLKNSLKHEKNSEKKEKIKKAIISLVILNLF